MKLPADSIIAHEKLTSYILAPRKRNDKSKWMAQAGYFLENWRELEHDLRRQILSLDATPIDKTEYGQLYEIKGKLFGPNGRFLSICSIWITKFKSGQTKFVTMFPDKRKVQ
ncbi:MAG: hypothetical protein GXO74_03280 [Calditrichaeota bacterium]|nr:hypothetical protein [Calditrichota bacterium]